MALGVPNYLPRNNFIRYLLRKRQKFKIGHMPPRAALQVRSASSSPFSESLTSRPNYPGELSWQTNCFGNMAAAVEEKKEEPSGVYVYSPKPPLETTLTAKDLSYTMNVIRGVPVNPTFKQDEVEKLIETFPARPSRRPSSARSRRTRGRTRPSTCAGRWSG